MSLHAFQIEEEPTMEHDLDLIERYYRAQARLTALEHELAVADRAEQSARRRIERLVAREREVVQIARAELRSAALLDGPSYVHCTAPASSDGPRSVAV